jgi:WhiB family redox-sensing transcriptional regulator
VDGSEIRWLMTTGRGDEFPDLDDFLQRPSWHRWAACRGEAPDTFVGGRGANYIRARELCAECTVRAECLAYALADEELVGLWAGTSDSQRRALRAGRVVA